MKIATDNVNGINGLRNVLLRWLKENRPDVVCLQDPGTTDDKFPQRELEKAGYGAAWQGQRS